MTLPAAVIHARLDADPSDSAARLLLAELCDEHGDAEQARGLRHMVKHRIVPFRMGGYWRLPYRAEVPRSRQHGWEFTSCASAQRALFAALAATERSE